MSAVDATQLAARRDAWGRDRGSIGLAFAVGDAAPLTAHRADDTEGEPRFLAYSITKTILATLMLRLQEAGRVSLEAPLARWYAEVPSAERITLRALLRHRSGLPDYGAVRAYHEAVRATPGVPWSFERFAAETWERGLLAPPEREFAYSNPGYLLLRRIAERVGDEDFEGLLQRHVAAPLGLARTHVANAPEDLAVLAPAFSVLLSEDEEPRDVRDTYHPGWVSHGTVVSTPSELTRFLRGVFDGSLLARDSLAQMTELRPVAHAPSTWREPGYGLGLMGDRHSLCGPLFGHGGGGPGTVAAVFHAPALAGGGVTACAMCAIEEDRLAEQVVFDVLEACANAPP